MTKKRTKLEDMPKWKKKILVFVFRKINQRISEDEQNNNLRPWIPRKGDRPASCLDRYRG